MKTIEERAMKYANNNPHGNPYNWNAHHDAYVDGAKEQKEIDDIETNKLLLNLNKTWREQFEKYERASIENTCNLLGALGLNESMIAFLKKAMEK